MRRRVITVLILITFMVALGACGSISSDKTSESQPSEDVSGPLWVAVIDFADIPSHRDCYEGFVKGLEDEGYIEGDDLVITYQDADTRTKQMDSIAEDIAALHPDLVCAVSTPAATAAYQKLKDTDIPMVYAAVSDPIAAKLSDESGNSTGDNITGTSDELPVDHQLQMIRDILPDAKKIGIIYNKKEVNSVSTLETYKLLAKDYGFKIVEKHVKNRKGVKRAARKLAKKVDCFSNLTDNTVASALKTELKAAHKKGIPVFGSEMEQVRDGCLACEGIDYYELGVETGSMAAQILSGSAKPSDIKFREFPIAEIFLNQEAADRLGITFNDSVRDAATEIFRDIKPHKAD